MGWLLTFYNWRSVVVMNVIPGIVVAGIILVYVGRLQMADIRSGFAKAKPDKIPGAERLRHVGRTFAQPCARDVVDRLDLSLA